MLDTETGELVKKPLAHVGEEPKTCYAGLPGPARVGRAFLSPGPSGEPSILIALRFKHLGSRRLGCMSSGWYSSSIQRGRNGFDGNCSDSEGMPGATCP